MLKGAEEHARLFPIAHAKYVKYHQQVAGLFL